ncbi:MAG TPA: hypothetical protein VFM10_07215, partial [Terriglobales bacterium]|nr:hypothetical protein [Terriglobales bacterium]
GSARGFELVMTITSVESGSVRPAAPTPADMENNVAAVLTSWKEIASYLGKGVRTVQRWERELGLPVRRPKPKEKQIVLAFPGELDRWVRHANPYNSIAKMEQQTYQVLAGEFARTKFLVSHMADLIRIAHERTAELMRSLECEGTGATKKHSE